MRLVRIATADSPIYAAIGAAGRLTRVSGSPAASFVETGERIGDVADATLLAPAKPGKIIAIGANYRDHIREAGMEESKAPLIFAKFPSSVVGSGAPIIIYDSLTARVDWEVELAIAVGKTMRHVPIDRVFEHVLGYTVANDVSARDVQFGDGQWSGARVSTTSVR